MENTDLMKTFLCNETVINRGRKWSEHEYSLCEDFATIKSKEDFFASLDIILCSKDSTEIDSAMIGAAWNPKIVSGEWDLREIPIPLMVGRKLVEVYPISLQLIENLLKPMGRSLPGSLGRRHHWLPTEFLEKLAKDPRSGEGLAYRKDLSKKAIWSLVKSPSAIVRATVAAQPTLSTDMIDWLSTDEDSIPLNELLRQKHLSDYALTELSKTTHPKVRLKLARNAHTLPKEALWNLISDSNYEIRNATLKREDLPEDFKVAAALR